MTGAPGQGRVATLDLLKEMVAQGAVRAPGLSLHGPIEGGGEDYIIYCQNHTLTHPLAWEEPGVGTLILTQSQTPHYNFQMLGPSAYL